MVKGAPGGGGSWIELAEKLARESSGMSRSERQSLLEREALGGLQAKSIGRMIRAYGHVRSLAKSERMTVREVKASLSAIEDLERLNRKAPGIAAPIRASVLRGEMGHRELQELARGVARQDPAPAEEDWNALGWRLYDFVLGNDQGWIRSNSPESGYSAIAKFLKVDLEAESNDNGRFAIYLSPRFALSEGRGGPVEDHLVRALAATHFFDGVAFVAADGQEREAVKRYSELAAYREGLERFSVYEIGQVPRA